MDDPENPYAPAHRAPAGPNDDRPTAFQIIQHECLIGKLSDAVIFITGCSSGIGVETARALSSTGATLYLTARDLTKAREALGPDLAKDPKVHLLKLDLDSLESVRTCAKEFLSKSDKLNILITNAGIRHVPFSKTKDGFERHFAVNHLAHFLLAHMLLPMLQQSSRFGFESRVVALSSTAHRHSPIMFTDLNFEQPGVYGKEKGYAQSKLANVYMASEITRRYGLAARAQEPPRPGVWGLAVHPGGIRSGLQKHSDAWEVVTWYYARNLMKLLHYMKSTEQGAATTVVAAVAKRFEARGGLYLEDCGLAVPVRKGWGLIDPGYVPGRTDNEEDARRLWAVGCQLVGVRDDGL